jgi:translocation and assembly module TamB
MDEAALPPRDPPWAFVARIFMWLALGVLALVLLAAIAGKLIDTDPGRRWLTSHLVQIAPQSGLTIRASGIEGSIFDKLVIHDLRLGDPKGVFLEAPKVVLDWRPQGLIRERLHINALSVPEARMLRLPELRPSKKKGPLLPQYDIYVGHFRFGHVVLEPAVLGRRQELSAAGGLNIADGRLLAAVEAASPTGGDALVARIDARPDEDRFDVDARLTGPAGGVIARLLKLDRNLAVRIEGDGRWSKWSGSAVGTLGEQRLFDLALDAADGRFALKGKAAPGLAIGGIVQRLGSPQVEIDAVAALAERVLDTRLTLRSPSIAVSARGKVDLGRDRFDDFAVHADLLKPPSLIRTLTARDMQLDLTLDGALGTPTFEYRLTADWLALARTRLEKVVASGKGQVSEGPLAFPIDARVARVVGVGEFVEELATNVRLRGPLRVEHLMLMGDGMNLTSDRVSGKARLRVDLRTGRYDVDLAGQVMRYAIPGLGIVDINADLNFVPDPGNPRQLRLRGKARATVTRLDNGFLKWLFAGSPTVTADIDRAPSGTITFTNARLTSSDMQLAGRGAYALGQQIRFSGRGVSKRFGPLEVELEGLVSRPRATVVLQAYKAGLTLANVRAVLTPEPNAYAFTAAADSALGPVQARGRIVTTPGATAYEVAALDIGGITARGTLKPTPSGPVAGTMAVSGGGVEGTVRLAAQGAVQRMDAALTARTARLATDPPVSIRRGMLKATLLAESEGPNLSAQFDLEGVRQGELTLDYAKGTVEMTGGMGTAAALVAGERGVPFTLDLAAAFEPGKINVTSKGAIAKQPFRLADTARLTAIQGGWQLAPVVLQLPEGTARISGTFADAVSLSADLSGAGLELFDLAVPGLGLTGTASGKVAMTFPPGGLPRGSAELRVRDFSRASEAYGRPVDMTLVALLEADKAALRAAFSDNGKAVGRFQARLASIPGAIDDPWVDRLSAAPLSAQLRWRGPSEMLWPLTGVGALSMRGNVAVALEIGGVLGDPQLTGLVRSRAVRIESGVTGTAIDNVRLAGRFTGPRLELETFTGTAGKGTISGSGHIDLSMSRGFPIDIALNLKAADILNRDDLKATATGPLRIRNSPEGAVISGNLEIDQARFRIGRKEEAEIPTLKVKEVSRDLVRDQRPERPPTAWQLDIKARANNKIDVVGMGLESEWRTDLDIKGPATQPRLTGTAHLIRGDYEFAGRRFELTRGELRFTGTYPPDPILDIAAEARVEGLTATIAIRGTGQRPEIAFSSVPALPQDEVLSRVLFGTSVSSLSAPEALQLAGAVASLRGGGNGTGLNPIGTIQNAIGLDRLRLMETNTQTGQRTAVAAGRYLTDRVYLEVATDAQGYTATQLEIELTRALSILSQVATLGGSSVNLRWSKDY